MNSATLLSSAAGVFRRKLWLPALYFFAFLFVMPIRLAMTLQNYLDPARYSSSEALLRAAERAELYTREFFSAGDGVLVLLIFAAFFTMPVFFAYLHDQRQIDFYHSLPVRRERLFAEHFLAALAAVVLPYLINLLLSLAVAAALGTDGLSAGAVLAGCASHLLLLLSLYALGAVTAMLAGNRIVHALLSLVLFGFAPLLIYGYVSLRETLQPAWYSQLIEWDWIVIHSSPAARYIGLLNDSYPLTWGDVVALLVFILLALFFALLLYRHRPSEAAGRALAFPISRPIIKYPLMLLAMTGFALVLYSISGDLVWYYVGAVLGGFLSAQIMEVIYRFDFRGAAKKLLPMAAMILLFCGGSLLLERDVFGYNSYVPQQNVAAVEVYFRGSLEDYYSYQVIHQSGTTLGAEDADARLRRGRSEDPAAIAAMQRLATILAEDPEQAVAGEALPQENNNHTFVRAVMRFTLDNGKTVTREYSGSADVCTVIDELEALFADDDFLSRRYNMFEAEAGQLRLQDVISFEDISLEYGLQPSDVLSYEEQAELQRLNLDISELLATYQQELLAMSLAEKLEAPPIGRLVFYRFQKDPGTLELNWENTAVDQGLAYMCYEYPLYAGFEHTLALLEEIGYPPEYWQFQPQYAVRAEYYDEEADAANNAAETDGQPAAEVTFSEGAAETMPVPTLDADADGWTITDDAAEIAALAAATWPADACYSGFTEYDSGDRVTIIFRDEFGNLYYQERLFPLEH